VTVPVPWDGVGVALGTKGVDVAVARFVGVAVGGMGVKVGVPGI
jgi:hypothetical protein